MDDVAVKSPDGSLVALTALERVSPGHHRIHFAPQITFGDYAVTVGPNITDLAGHAMDQDGNGLPGQPSDVYNGLLTTDSSRSS